MEEKKQQPLIILGSARKNSDTAKAVKLLFNSEAVVVCNLLDYKIHHYDYTGHYPADDSFKELVQQLLAHRVLVFATPVYWYSMSGHMKVFFDRLTDLVTIFKTQGRQLKGKKVFLLAVGDDEEMPEGFVTPFKLTAAYLDMEFAGSYYCTTRKFKAQATADDDSFIASVLG